MSGRRPLRSRSRSPNRETSLDVSSSGGILGNIGSSPILPTTDPNPAASRNGFRRGRSNLRGGAGANGRSNGRGNGDKSEGPKFNPKLIFGQIVSLQCFHYVIWTVLIQINSLLYRNTPVSTDRLFSDMYLRIWNSSGWPDLMAVLISSACGSVLLAIIVEKAKKCLDFGLTLFVIHLLVCTMYMHHLPKTWDWWLAHVAGTIGMILGGENLCARRELDDIPLLTL